MNFGDDYIEVNPYKYGAEMPKEPPKYKLIDILNKIANGELKEGTKVIWGKVEYIFTDGELERKRNDEIVSIFEDMYCINLNDEECELIEPQEPKECEHEWKRYCLGRLGQRTENHRYCPKCGTDEIEPTDNTKIEELDPDNYNLDNLSLIVTDTFKKLNEVIRYINK